MDGSGGTKIATIWRAWEICLTIGECVGHCLGYSVVGYFTRYACTWIHPRFVVMVCCSRFTFLCKSLFVLLSVFFWSLYCLSFFWSLYCLSLFYLWLLFILLVSSNFSCTILAILLRPLVFLLFNYWTSRSYDFLIIGLPDLMAFILPNEDFVVTTLRLQSCIYWR